MNDELPANYGRLSHVDGFGWVIFLCVSLVVQKMYKEQWSVLDPIERLTRNTHCRVVTEVDQEKGRCPDRFDPMPKR